MLFLLPISSTLIIYAILYSLAEYELGPVSYTHLIKNEDKELYEYAVNIILSSLIHIATVMIIGLCFNFF